MFKLAICAIAKDEREDYIREWIDWHLKLGVDFIYIFDNESKIPLKELLKDKSNVGVAPCIGKVMQLPAYDFFLNRYKGIVEWCAFIDIDEFIIVKKDVANLAKQLDYYPVPYAGIGLYWRSFGSNSLIDNSDPQTKAFTRRTNENHPMNEHVKSIVRLNQTSKPLSPHHFQHTIGPFVNDIGQPLNGPINKNKSYQNIYINHYHLRSYNDFLKKLERGRADTTQARVDNFTKLDSEATTEDRTAIELWEIIKDKEYKKIYTEEVYLRENPDILDLINKNNFTCGLDHWLLDGRNQNKKCV